MALNVKEQLITLINNFANTYLQYEIDQNESNKKTVINDLKILHSALESFGNFKLISNDFDGLLDKLLEKYSIVQVCTIIELIFNRQMFIVLTHNYDKQNDINHDYHSSLILINKLL